MKRMIFTILAFLSFMNTANAVQEPRPLPADSRIQVITYNPNSVHQYVGFYEYQASIVFEDGEEIQTISMGDPNAWQVAPAGSRLFIKPVADNPEDTNTNMLVITNKRVYHFILSAVDLDDEDKNGINNPNLVFETRFLYNDAQGNDVRQLSKSGGPDLSEPEKYNFNYTVSGSEIIAPLRAFDDGEFTYFMFRDKNADIPSFFLVDGEGRESIVNFRVEGDYVVVERVASQFTLRHGSDIACIFNETMPLRRVKKKK